MCFTEFIGYTCGHTSIEVLRPCPLTTHFHANPICATYGRRSILAQEMCPACQRILHGRAVLILEWEHHWMHERGVCGCPVIFPDLIQPRVITPSRPFEATKPVTRPTPVAINTVDKSLVKNYGNTKVVYPEKSQANNAGGSQKRKKKKPIGPQGDPHFNGQDQTAKRITDNRQQGPNQPGGKHPEIAEKRPDETQQGRSKFNSSSGTKSGESQQGGTAGQNKPTVVPARIHSFYGAEWVDEHRQLHNAGSCKCAADFSNYQTPDLPEITELSSLPTYNSLEQAVAIPMADLDLPADRMIKNFNISAASERYSESRTGPWGDNLNYSSYRTQATDPWSQGEQAGQLDHAHRQYQLQEPCLSAGQPANIHQGAQPGEWSTAQQQPGLPSNIGQPTRSSGAIYQVDLTKSTNPLYNYACIEGGKQGGRIGRCVDIQNLDYVRAKNAPPPLVGLPIGAGPEAPEYLEHMGRFEDCVLHQNDKGKQGQRAGGATKSQTAAQLQQTIEPEQTSDTIGFQVFEGPLTGAKDIQETRMPRLTHKKSASAAYTRLSWDGNPLCVQSGSGHSSTAHSKDDSEVDEGEDLHLGAY